MNTAKSSTTVFFILLLFSLSGCSQSIGEQIAIGEPIMVQIAESDSDLAIVSLDQIAFIFSNNRDGEWTWNEMNQPRLEIEYGWWASFTLDEKQYLCGHHYMSRSAYEPKSGPFEQLIDAGRSVCNTVKFLSNETTGARFARVAPDWDTRVESFVESDKLVVIAENEEFVSLFRAVRPDTIQFRKPPSLIYKVAVTYTSE